jgi:hypothetical protein
MAAYLAPNTVQRVQQFLGSLDVQAPPYATSQEVVELLVQRVRERRDQIAFRQDLQALAQRLNDTNGTLPTPKCETRSPEALANELASLLADEGGPGVRSGTLSALAAMMLWAAITTGSGCTPSDPTEDPDCAQDAGISNFEALVAHGAGMGDCEVVEYADQYEPLSEETKSEVVAELCAMTPDQITNYLSDNFADPGCAGDDDDQADDDAVYKGVSF